MLWKENECISIRIEIIKVLQCKQTVGGNIEENIIITGRYIGLAGAAFTLACKFGATHKVRGHGHACQVATRGYQHVAVVQPIVIQIIIILAFSQNLWAIKEVLNKLIVQGILVTYIKSWSESLDSESKLRVVMVSRCTCIARKNGEDVIAWVKIYSELHSAGSSFMYIRLVWICLLRQ